MFLFCYAAYAKPRPNRGACEEEYIKKNNSSYRFFVCRVCEFWIEYLNMSRISYGVRISPCIRRDRSSINGHMIIALNNECKKSFQQAQLQSIRLRAADDSRVHFDKKSTLVLAWGDGCMSKDASKSHLGISNNSVATGEWRIRVISQPTSVQQTTCMMVWMIATHVRSQCVIRQTLALDASRMYTSKEQNRRSNAYSLCFLCNEIWVLSLFHRGVV